MIVIIDLGCGQIGTEGLIIHVCACVHIGTRLQVCWCIFYHYFSPPMINDHDVCRLYTVQRDIYS